MKRLVLALLFVITACATPQEEPHTAITRNDPAFQKTFSHEFADVDGVRMHYVKGGTGSPVVLLHGWPQTWYSWWPIMPELAERHTVYALDLPGLGDSTGTPKSFDKAALARYVHALTSELGLRNPSIVGHDLGAAVAFQYASQFPQDTARLGYLDLPLPGPAIDARTYRTLSWHIAFHSQPQVPEAIVQNDVRDYLKLFYPQVSYQGSAFGGTSTSSPFANDEIDEYARTYDKTLKNGFELYRALDQDVRDTENAKPVQAPTLVMAAEGQAEAIKGTASPRMTNIVRALDVPKAGHWLVEENPEFVTAELLRFLSS